MRTTPWNFSLFHARSLSKDSNKSAHLTVSLEPLSIVNANLCTGNCFPSEFPSKYEMFRHTGWSIKESWDVSGVYLLISLFIFYFILFFFVRVSLECKDVED